MERFSFPVTLISDEEDGGFVVTFRDLPEAITQGDTIEECLAEATDCLEEAIAARIDDYLEIPSPSPVQKGEQLVTLPLQIAFKAIVYLVMREAGISKLELAQRLQVDEKEVQQLLNPRQGTKLPIMERALSALGKQLKIHLSSLSTTSSQ